ncbi:hypothetical protein AWN76_015235 [Rhodothermaceae bacterium RA]|nr:hypothetical protein AWN76_015235 [Rhodothermaceae bacterium RA]
MLPGSYITADSSFLEPASRVPVRLHRPWPVALLVVGLLFGGCARTAPVAADGPPPRATVGFITISDSLAPDAALERLIQPYRDHLEATTAEVIGTAAVALTKSEPESLLGNLAADALLAAAQTATGTPADLAVTNNGGLRVSLPAGPITLGQIYELMPFENTVVVLTLTGAEVDSLARQIARLGGEPIAGWSFRITPDEQAADVRVDGRPLDPNRTYRVATIDYLADGGGGMPALWSPQARQNTRLLFRDAIAAYIRAQTAAGEALAPRLEGRITRTDGDGP